MAEWYEREGKASGHVLHGLNIDRGRYVGHAVYLADVDDSGTTLYVKRAHSDYGRETYIRRVQVDTRDHDQIERHLNEMLDQIVAGVTRPKSRRRA